MKTTVVTASGVISLPRNNICEKNTSGIHKNCSKPFCQKEAIKKINAKIKDDTREIYFID